MNTPRKLKTDHQQEQTTSMEAVSHAKHAVDFGSVEEMLRHDALHTPVPPRIAERLKISLGDAVAGDTRPWWKRILGS